MLSCFYVGIKEIASFLRLHPRTVYRHLKAGRLPARRDCLGRWILVERDYWRNLKDDNQYHSSDK